RSGGASSSLAIRLPALPRQVQRAAPVSCPPLAPRLLLARRMADPEPPETESFTAWHPMLVALLEFYLPGGWKLLPELLLSRLPQRVDIVVLRLVDAITGA